MARKTVPIEKAVKLSIARGTIPTADIDNVQDAISHFSQYVDQVTSTISGDYTAKNTDKHLVCNGTMTVTLQPSALRHGELKVTNAGDGIVTIQSDGVETINGQFYKTLAYKWTTIDLAPINGGYVI